jgi:hypothetical protein
MANIVYQSGLVDLLTTAKTWGAGVWKAALERSTSTYASSKDDDSLLDKAGLVLITVAAYVTQTIASPTVAADNSNDRVVISCATISFGNLEAGQTVKSILIYRDDGGNGVPLLRIDTDSGALLPRALGGGAFTVTLNAVGLMTIAQS